MGGFQNGLRGVPLVLAFAAIGFFGLHASHALTLTTTAEAEAGVTSGNTTAGDPNGASGGAAVKFQADSTPTPPAPPAAITNLPSQPAALVYGDDAQPPSSYDHPGALVVAGRVNYGGAGFKAVSAAGGTVLIYLDTVVNGGTYGRYHDMLISSSECGGAVPNWPGAPKANSFGFLMDFRVGSVEQNKLECVLEKMVAENPHMGGWFADDLGSHWYFPSLDFNSWSDKAAYQAGAIQLTKTFRKVANEHGLIFIVNGTWDDGNDGGGYPDPNKFGNALADGGMVEHHDGQESFFGPYGCSTQWAAQSPVTKGKAFMYSMSASASDRDAYSALNCYAYTASQSDYSNAPAPWSGFHATGLPSKVGGPVSP
jgi:hypothetical protein